ncbi:MULTISPECIES: hypothetical protein [unclassified Campylobacter]|uniref:hypothetical protein n=1 Tax=unclassified Campylobacter TaxID=2593542 RepID=UPI0022E9CC93|nr:MULTISPECIES: hypothetical protein [unclassified Campylobacter]MDA3054236.1 DUF4870 domain-containing protein [Campylobacter sp. VBCF_07 NA4]MDA3060927.1 DUF4870 domain-containing protein [Campylobacter sp. VBCF_02 NA5]MDA3070440.1 DUF4870 domain-containing protein [Campylobacter sp. VBCF_08 NA3]WBR53749.1 hypothetical protein PF027_05300 [Campylobacter sp. VBCF_01 NA2]
MEDEKIIVINQGSGNTAGILAIVFAILGIFFLGILFVPLALVCAIIATIKAIKGVASKLVAIISWILIIIAFATSPMLLGMLSIGMTRQEVKTTPIGLAYSQEFETALKQIRDDFSLRGEFRDLQSMTTVRHFKDEALKQKLEVGKPIEYSVGLKSKGQIEFCAQMVLKESGSKYIIETKNINENKDICRELHNAELYKKLKTFEIN